MTGDRWPDGYELTRDPARIDVDRVHHWLAEESYWATDRDHDVVARSVAGSLVWGVLADGAQVAFARAVTDRATFAWLCDVCVGAAHRGRGVGHRLVDAAVADLTAMGVPRILLATRDAHELYRRSGFTELARPATYMQIDRRPPQPWHAGA